jgi:tetratricopeptide (TPR) repeat protein
VKSFFKPKTKKAKPMIKTEPVRKIQVVKVDKKPEPIKVEKKPEPVKVVAAKPVLEPTITVVKAEDVTQEVVEKVKAAKAKEDSLDDVKAAKDAKAFESRRIYSKRFKGNQEFYTRLPEEQKTEFRRLFVEEGADHLVESLQYTIGDDNTAFFDRVYNMIYRYRRLISLPLLTSLLNEGLRLATDDEDDAEAKTNIYEAVIRTAYTQRNKKGYLAAAEQWSREDVKLHDDTLKTKGSFVYGYKRLAIILEKKGAIPEAIKLVENALKKDLKDDTIGEYPERLVRLQAQLAIDEAKAKNIFVEKVEETVEVTDDESDETEEVVDQVDLSGVTFKKTGFYEGLTPVLQKEFDRYFIEEGDNHLVKSLQFTRGETNQEFFANVFNQIYKYRRLISFDLLTALHEELTRQVDDQPELLTKVNEAAIRVYFYRRKDRVFIERCEELCQEDIALHLDVLKTKKGFVYSFKRLAILLERQSLFEDAIAMCDRAIALKLDDMTKGNYLGRKQRLQRRIAIRKGE